MRLPFRAHFGKTVGLGIILLCMFRAFENWQRIATLWLVVWLSAQAAVIGLVPTWGAALPHSHITRGNMTDADWAAHAREHRLGVSAHAAYEAGCETPTRKHSARVIASVPDADGIFSILPAFAAAFTTPRIEIFECHLPTARVLLHTFAARARFDAPPTPPPNA